MAKSKLQKQPGRLVTLGEPALVESIRSAILDRGPITFASFMEQALYHPQHGYYSSGRAALGRAGDYFTSVSVGPLFGRLLALQFAEMWRLLGGPDGFAIIEQGAHGGELAGDILSAAEIEHPKFFDSLRYTIVEPFAVWRARQAAALTKFAAKMDWQPSLAELALFRGVHFSNELIDAFPVHLVKWTGTEWMERFVGLAGGGFEFVDRPLSDARLSARLRVVAGPLPSGYETEINLVSAPWLETLAAKLISGWILAADYGYARDEYYAPSRTAGTLRCSARHQVVPSPLVAIGQADITAHVDWTSLAEEARTQGLTLSGFADQHHFITGLLTVEGGAQFIREEDAKVKRALQTLLHPGLLGMKFQFLALARNVPPEANLSGLRFAHRIALRLSGELDQQ